MNVAWRVVALSAWVLAAVGLTGAPALAEQGRGGSSHGGHDGMSHEGHEEHGSAGHEGPETHRSGGHAAVPQGAMIREAKIDGFALAYRVYAWSERNAMMKGMEGHEMHGMDGSGRSTHHLMLFVQGPDGREPAAGKVGFVVTGPDQSEFKTLTMAMSGGYGADIPLKAPGTYRIRTKAVFGDRTLSEEFSYTVK